MYYHVAHTAALDDMFLNRWWAPSKFLGITGQKKQQAAACCKNFLESFKHHIFIS